VARLKEVQNLPFLSGLLLITGCGHLERVFNIPQVGILKTSHLHKNENLEDLCRLQPTSILHLDARYRFCWDREGWLIWGWSPSMAV
ncbi:unnamed protein product, partial [Urochloa humidicola]